jgi:hypothetical protein
MGSVTAFVFAGPGTGRAPVFESAGAGTIPAGKNGVTILEPARTPESQVVITLLGNRGRRAVLRNVRRAGGKFTVFLTGRAAVGTPLSYFVFRSQ